MILLTTPPPPFIPQRGNKCLEIIFILSEKTHETAIMSWSIFNICSMWFLKLDFYIKVIPICSKIHKKGGSIKTHRLNHLFISYRPNSPPINPIVNIHIPIFHLNNQYSRSHLQVEDTNGQSPR